MRGTNGSWELGITMGSKFSSYSQDAAQVQTLLSDRRDESVEAMSTDVYIGIDVYIVRVPTGLELHLY